MINAGVGIIIMSSLAVDGFSYKRSLNLFERISMTYVDNEPHFFLEILFDGDLNIENARIYGKVKNLSESGQMTFANHVAAHTFEDDYYDGDMVDVANMISNEIAINPNAVFIPIKLNCIGGRMAARACLIHKSSEQADHHCINCYCWRHPHIDASETNHDCSNSLRYPVIGAMGTTKHQDLLRQTQNWKHEKKRSGKCLILLQFVLTAHQPCIVVLV
jgi:hypothetical protein